MEQWKPIDGFHGYEVSDLGRVRSWRAFGRSKTKKPLATPRIRKPTADKRGYLRVMVYRNGKYVNIVVHQAVAKAFLGPRPTGKEVCHRDGNPGNNIPANLRWDTRKSNMQDARRHGTVSKKSRSLTMMQAEEIRRRRHAGEKGRTLAKEFGVDPAVICFIFRGKTYVK